MRMEILLTPFLKALGGIEEDLLLKAKGDVVGRTFQDLGLKVEKEQVNEFKTFSLLQIVVHFTLTKKKR